MISLQAVLCALVLAAGDAPVANVDGTDLTAQAYRLRRAALARQGRPASATEVLDSLVAEVLLAAEGRRRGLDQAPEARTQVEAEVRRATVDAYVEKEFGGKTAPPDPMLRELYHSVADSAQVELLTYPSREAAQAARARLEKGATFPAEAANAVTAQVGAPGAPPAAVVRGQLDGALAAALFGSPAGALVGPVELAVGWGVARAATLQLGDEAGFAARRPALVERARKQLAGQAREHVKAQLRKASGVKLDEPFLQQLGRRGDATEAELDHVLATVDGAPLRLRDLSARLRYLAGQDGSGHLSSPAIKIQVAWAEIDDRLLYAEAARRGLRSSPEVAAQAALAERGVVASAAAERIAAAVPPPSAADVEAFVKKNPPPHGAPPEAVQVQATARLLADRRNAAVGQAVAALRKKAAIRVDEQALAAASQEAR